MSIPNTLSIFINTRIRNYPKIRYEPNMTVPKVRSQSVFFDPLIKLSNFTTRSLPNGVLKSEKYTQFFNKNEYNSLISRTISSSFTGQKKLTLKEATNAGNIDNNIRVTLDQLFAPNSVFYIKDKPYTIYSYNWTKGDWKVDTKSFEKQMSYIPYGTSMNYALYRQPDGRTSASQADRELRKLMDEGDELVNGSLIEAGFSKFKQEEKGKISDSTVNKGDGKKGIAKGILSKEETREIIEEEKKKNYRSYKGITHSTSISFQGFNQIKFA